MLKEIKVGPIKYKITKTKSKTFKDWGQCDPEKCRILVNASLTGDKMMVVLFHEILHAIFTEYEKPKVDPLDYEEDIVSFLSSALMNTIHDNKKEFREIFSL